MMSNMKVRRRFSQKNLSIKDVKFVCSYYALTIFKQTKFG